MEFIIQENTVRGKKWVCKSYHDSPRRTYYQETFNAYKGKQTLANQNQIFSEPNPKAEKTNSVLRKLAELSASSSHRLGEQSAFF